MSTDGKGDGDTGIKQRLHSTKEAVGNGSTTNAPERASTAPSSGSRQTLPPASDNLLLQAVFLNGHIKLAETHSTILGGATRHNKADGDYFSNALSYMRQHNSVTTLALQH